MTGIEIRSIRIESDYELALDEIASLMADDPLLGTPEGDRLDLLITLVQAYEAQRHPVPPPDSIQIANEPVRAALDKLKHLTADAKTRRLAFVRERALRETATNLIRSSDLDDAAIAAATGLSTTDISDLRQHLR